jgi:hypothetical protein
MTDTMNFFEEKELSATSITELQHMVKVLAEKRANYEEEKKKVSALYVEVDELEKTILNVLAETNQKSFTVQGVGTITRSLRTTYSYPKDPDVASKLRQKLIGTDNEDLLTINSARLNSHINQRKLQEEIQGKIYIVQDEFPELGEPSSMEIMSLTKKGK